MAVREVLMNSRATYHDLLTAATTTAVQVWAHACLCGCVCIAGLCRHVQWEDVSVVAVPAVPAVPAVQAAVSRDSLAPVEVGSQGKAAELFRQLALPPTFRAEVRQHAVLRCAVLCCVVLGWAAMWCTVMRAVMSWEACCLCLPAFWRRMLRISGRLSRRPSLLWCPTWCGRFGGTLWTQVGAGGGLVGPWLCCLASPH